MSLEPSALSLERIRRFAAVEATKKELRVEKLET
jgi:hypothetical protein